MRLIDADNLKIPNDAPYKASVKRVVAQQPTVEAKPIVRGEWKHRKNWDKYVCSVCSHEHDHESNFCEQCGCDMRGENHG